MRWTSAQTQALGRWGTAIAAVAIAGLLAGQDAVPASVSTGLGMLLVPVLTFAVALGWSGRSAWAAAAVTAAGVAVIATTDPTAVVPVLMFSVAPWLVGTALRHRMEADAALQHRGRELEEERELVADLARRHERARIAGELHDIVGHAISVLVVQAAAGQRLLDADPAAARAALTTIAQVARQGAQDVGQLVELLGDVAAPDLSELAEAVRRAAAHGIDVTCTVTAETRQLTGPAAALVVRVVQESMTNALRHAPGAGVAVVVEAAEAALVVSVENGPRTGDLPMLTGTGRGLSGLRTRALDLGGRLAAGPTVGGGWRVEAVVPLSRPDVGNSARRSTPGVPAPPA